MIIINHFYTKNEFYLILKINRNCGKEEKYFCPTFNEPHEPPDRYPYLSYLYNFKFMYSILKNQFCVGNNYLKIQEQYGIYN